MTRPETTPGHSEKTLVEQESGAGRYTEGSGDTALEEAGSMTLTGHLAELRKRLLISLGVMAAAFVVCFSLAGRFVTLFTDLGERYGYSYVFIAPQELLLVYFSLAFVAAAAVSAPVIAYEVYAFCSPGLRKKERSGLRAALFFGALFFLLGIIFAYEICIPFMLYFLISLSFSAPVSAMISVGEYINFLLTVFLIFGIIFELPVISVLLTRLGIVNAALMARARKAVIVGIFLLAAVITPPDIASQIMTAIPMIGLYELSIVLSRLTEKRAKET